MVYDKEKWIYENDADNNRFVLGTRGKNTLLCFGINPSTARPDNLDNTLKSVQRLALSNGYDSWIMMNVYPQRATNPNDIHQSIEDRHHRENLKAVENILAQNTITIWAAWGTLIEKRTFLKECLGDIYKLSMQSKCEWISIGKISKAGHPHHPLYVRNDAKCVGFNMAEYISKLGL